MANTGFTSLGSEVSKILVSVTTGRHEGEKNTPKTLRRMRDTKVSEPQEFWSEQAADRKSLKKWPYRTSYRTAMCMENMPNLKRAWLSLRPKKMKALYLLHRVCNTRQWGLCNVSISANSCLFFVNPSFIVYLLCSQRPQASHQQLSSNKRVAQNKAGHGCRYETQLAAFPVAY